MIFRQRFYFGRLIYGPFSHGECVFLFKMSELLIIAVPLFSQKSGVPFYWDVRFQPRGALVFVPFYGGALLFGGGVSISFCTYLY